QGTDRWDIPCRAVQSPRGRRAKVRGSAGRCGGSWRRYSASDADAVRSQPPVRAVTVTEGGVEEGLRVGETAASEDAKTWGRGVFASVGRVVGVRGIDGGTPLPHVALEVDEAKPIWIARSGRARFSLSEPSVGAAAHAGRELPFGFRRQP